MPEPIVPRPNSPIIKVNNPFVSPVQKHVYLEWKHYITSDGICQSMEPLFSAS